MDPIAPDKTCVEALQDLLEGLPGVRVGKMFGLPAFFVGRKLFACVYREVVGIRVPEQLAERLLADSRFASFQPYGGRKMREWIQFPCVPREQMADFEEVLLAAYEFVGGGGA